MVRQLVYEKENSELKPVKLRLKIDLVSYPARAEGLVNSINKCPRYNIKQSDHKALVMQELWVRWSTPLLALLPGPLYGFIYGSIELLDI